MFTSVCIEMGVSSLCSSPGRLNMCTGMANPFRKESRIEIVKRSIMPLVLVPTPPMNTTPNPSPPHILSPCSWAYRSLVEDPAARIEQQLEHVPKQLEHVRSRCMGDTWVMSI